MKTSQILRKAKLNLWGGDGNWDFRQKSYGLCGAITMVVYNTRSTQTNRQKAENVIRRISKSLNHYLYVSGWLRKVAKVPENRLTSENLQFYRQLWLDELIAEYESKGD